MEITKKQIQEFFKNDLGFAPSLDEIEIKNDDDIATVVVINGHYYDYYKQPYVNLIYRQKQIEKDVQDVVNAFAMSGYERADIERILKQEDVQRFIEQHQCRNERYGSDFKCDLSFAIEDIVD